MTIGLLGADAAQLVLGRGLGHEVIHASLGGDGGGGHGIVARDHDGADAHFTQLGKALLDAAFDDVLEFHNTEHAAALANDERRASGA